MHSSLLKWLSHNFSLEFDDITSVTVQDVVAKILEKAEKGEDLNNFLFHKICYPCFWRHNIDMVAKMETYDEDLAFFADAIGVTVWSP